VRVDSFEQTAEIDRAAFLRHFFREKLAIISGALE